jgi:hypothetical protein
MMTFPGPPASTIQRPVLVGDVFTAPSFFVKDTRSRDSGIPTFVVHPLVDTQLFSQPEAAPQPGPGDGPGSPTDGGASGDSSGGGPQPSLVPGKANWAYCRQKIGLGQPSDLVVGEWGEGPAVRRAHVTVSLVREGAVSRGACT